MLSEGISGGQSGVGASGLPQAPQLHTPVTMPTHAQGEAVMAFKWCPVSRTAVQPVNNPEYLTKAQMYVFI